MAERDWDAEIRKLGQDLAKGLAGLRFITNHNSQRLDRLEKTDLAGKVTVMEVHVEGVRNHITRSANIPERLTVLEVQVKELLDARKDHTGQITALKVNEARELAGVEKSKARWGLYAAIATGVLSGVASILIQLIKWLGETQ
jgi:phosphate-selective porin